MHHHWPVQRRPFGNQVKGKFETHLYLFTESVGAQNKNPSAASQTLLTGGRLHLLRRLPSVSVAQLHSRGSNPVLMTSYPASRGYIFAV